MHSPAIHTEVTSRKRVEAGRRRNGFSDENRRAKYFVLGTHIRTKEKERHRTRSTREGGGGQDDVWGLGGGAQRKFIMVPPDDGQQ